MSNRVYDPNDIEPIPDSQEEINKQADDAIRDLFPRIPNTDRQMVIDHAFKKVSGMGPVRIIDTNRTGSAFPWRANGRTPAYHSIVSSSSARCPCSYTPHSYKIRSPSKRDDVDECTKGRRANLLGCPR